MIGGGGVSKMSAAHSSNFGTRNVLKNRTLLNASINREATE